MHFLLIYCAAVPDTDFFLPSKRDLRSFILTDMYAVRLLKWKHNKTMKMRTKASQQPELM